MKPEFFKLEEKKLVYLVLKKCGCTSIIAGMNKLVDPDFDPSTPGMVHRDRSRMARLAELNLDDEWFLFTIVRDPIRRFLSFYSDKIRSNSAQLNQVTNNKKELGYHLNMSLSEAIDVTVGEKFRPDAHVYPQTRLIDYCNLDFSYVGRFEDFKTSFEQIAQQTGVSIPGFHLNPHIRNPFKIERDQFETLAAFYKADTERFGYPSSFDEWIEKNVSVSEEDFEDHQGNIFEGEATLIRHGVVHEEDRLFVELNWEVNPHHFRHRIVRVVEAQPDGSTELVFRLPMLESLTPLADENGIVNERVELKYDDIAKDGDLSKLFAVVFFWKEGPTRKAILRNSNNGNRLTIPLAR